MRSRLACMVPNSSDSAQGWGKMKESDQARESGGFTGRRSVPRTRELFHSPNAQRHWIVREIAAKSVAGAEHPRSLVCECANDGIVRRVWSFPERWYELPDDELRRLCEE